MLTELRDERAQIEEAITAIEHLASGRGKRRKVVGQGTLGEIFHTQDFRTSQHLARAKARLPGTSPT